MTKSIKIGVSVLVLAVLALVIAFMPLVSSATGNGAPSGAHYNLNIIGVSKGKTADMTGSNGHRIFVPLVGNCKINLSIGAFQVLDGNCTDGPSTFPLPNPDLATYQTVLTTLLFRSLQLDLLFYLQIQQKYNNTWNFQ